MAMNALTPVSPTAMAARTGLKRLRPQSQPMAPVEMAAMPMPVIEVRTPMSGMGT
jgi:hypothetical protein